MGVAGGPEDCSLGVEKAEEEKMKALVRVLLIPFLAVLSACSGDPDDPEQQIREMISAGEEVVEVRSRLSALDFIASGYEDKEGRQKKDIQRLVAGYILRNKSIHLLTRVQQVVLNEDEAQADVILYVGMAGQRTDLYRFDISVILVGGELLVAAGIKRDRRISDFVVSRRIRGADLSRMVPISNKNIYRELAPLKKNGVLRSAAG